MQSRADLTKYANGLRLCENFLIRAQGGVYSRPGLRFIGELADSSRKARLIPFNFNTEQAYILVFEHRKLRIIRDGGYVLTGANTIFELSTFYTEADLYDLGFTQSADVMTIVHPSYLARNLNRLADNNWSLDVINFSPSVTVPVLSSVVAVGSGAGDFSKTYQYVVTAVDADGVESLPSTKMSITTDSLSQTAGVRLTWGAVAGASYYRVYKDPSVNSDVYGWIGDSNTSTFDDYNIAPIISDSPPKNRTPFTGAGNNPSCVTYYQQRQVFASTTNEPQAVYTTQTGNFASLRTSRPARDDDAVTFTIAARQVNKVRHLLPLDSLIIFTSGGEWILTDGQDKVLTPSTVGVRIQSYNGCSKVPPVVINSTALYLQEKGARLRDLGYEFSNDKYTGNDLSLMSEHLFEGKEITSMVYAAEPYSIVWCVRSDGVLLGLTYQKEHQVWGWHKHTTDGEFESVAAISEEDRDAVYVVVKRTIDGQTKRFIERMERRESAVAEDAFCVDSGLTYTGQPATIISGLDHLEGKTVKILADGYVVEDQVVDNGTVTLDRAASKVHVGLGYTPAIETLDIDMAASDQTLKPQTVSVPKVVLDVEGSRGGFVAPLKDDGSPDVYMEIKPRFEEDGYGAIPLKSYQQEVQLSPRWSKAGGVRVEQRAPLPMAILSISPQIEIGGN